MRRSASTLVWAALAGGSLCCAPLASADVLSVPDEYPTIQAAIADDAGLDLNGNGVLDACECLADIFPDNVVNGADLGVYLAYAGPCGEGTGNPDCIGDLTGDGLVDGADLGYLLAAWGPCR